MTLDCTLDSIGLCECNCFSECSYFCLFRLFKQNSMSWVAHNRNTFLTFLEARKSKVKASAWSVSTFWFIGGAFLLCLHRVEG